MGRPELAGLAAPQCLSHTAREACSNYRFLRLKLPRDPRHLRGIHWLRGQIEEKGAPGKGKEAAAHTSVSGEPGHPVLLVETQQKGLLVEKQKQAGNVVLAASWR